MKILFLYTEISSYFLSCAEKLIPEYSVHIVRWSLNKEAPFRFSVSPGINIYEREKLDERGLIKLAGSIQPDLIYCSGWLDKAYLSVCRKFSDKIPVILGLDNQWKGSFRQRLATVLSPFTLKKYFSHCWVPGTLQAEYARRLGFPEENVFTGFYSCDHDYFSSLYKKYKEQKQRNFPKRFLFVGRYVESKGVETLWKAFIQLQQDIPNDWELWCAGTGPLAPVKHPKIKHLGFIQPRDMEEYIRQAGVFILPSLFEPWGVVVHEFAAAGFPLLLSDEVGARTAFLKENENGYLFKAGDTEAIMDCMKKLIQMPEETLIRMGEKSAVLSSCITPDTWAGTLRKIAGKVVGCLLLVISL